MISFDEAFEHVRAAAVPLGIEEVLLEDSAGRVLAAPVAARIDGPRSDVDGPHSTETQADLPGCRAQQGSDLDTMPQRRGFYRAGHQSLSREYAKCRGLRL